MNLRGIWQAAYTAGVVLPKPVATAQYWHRSLNPKKLISVGFSRLAVRARQFLRPVSGPAVALFKSLSACVVRQSLKARGRVSALVPVLTCMARMQASFSPDSRGA